MLCGRCDNELDDFMIFVTMELSKDGGESWSKERTAFTICEECTQSLLSWVETPSAVK